MKRIFKVGDRVLDQNRGPGTVTWVNVGGRFEVTLDKGGIHTYEPTGYRTFGAPGNMPYFPRLLTAKQCALLGIPGVVTAPSQKSSPANKFYVRDNVTFKKQNSYWDGIVFTITLVHPNGNYSAEVLSSPPKTLRPGARVILDKQDEIYLGLHSSNPLQKQSSAQPSLACTCDLHTVIMRSGCKCGGN